MRFVLLSILILISTSVNAKLIKPNPKINPLTVITIQLEALKENNYPYEDFGIEQTWEFSHPQNRQYTGPLSNFKLMMKSNSYDMMINHSNHNIIYVSVNEETANYFIEIIDKIGNKFGFTWTVTKVLTRGELLNCWMTSSVSAPMLLAKSA